MDERWWVVVRKAQLLQTDHWEMQYADQHAGKPFWINWVTGEKLWVKPVIEDPPRPVLLALDCDIEEEVVDRDK